MIIMMIDPKQYVEKYKNASYLELLKFKNELISCISDFEHDFDKEEWSWESSPGPDVGYQLNLELLGLIASLLKAAFNKEYEMGDKNMDDYLNDMREFYGE